ncbi:uncharacterized protein LOC113362216 isoform X2 [Papaver somniferum]|uniref:uncharacterized protein LOC113362216 isoform X2 n=1 Tax=Papaver somniferum TaxID=3469 RepID=UPI000E702CD1|nr:uncharacterized protein LOC113362216 isoform X2 [Papaver somniferum]
MSMTTLKAWREVLDINNQDPEVLKPQFLLKLYDLLISLSLESISQCPGEKLTNIRKISNFLFDELSRRFEHCFSNVGQGVLCSDSWGLLQDLTLLLRCCISMLHLLEFDLSLLIEKCKILLSILGKLCSPELASYVGRKGTNVISIKESTSHECTIAGKDCITSVVEEYETLMFFVQKSRASIPVLRSIIEPTFQNSFENFLLLSDEKPLFLDLISLNAAMQLLSTVLIYSPPPILQAYIISLVCGRSSINMASEDQASDPRLVNWYISAFEISMELYSRNMSSLQLGDDHEEPGSGSDFIKRQCAAGGLSHLSFESHIRPVMYSQLKVHTADFAKSSQDLASKRKSDLIDTCTAYMKENQNILNESYRDESFAVLCYIISRILSGDIRGNRLWKKGIISQQEMYLLASTVNLMSSSLLQIIWCMQKRSLGNPKILKDYSQCKEYDMIISIISCFQQSSISQPMTTLVMDMMAQFPARHKFSKMMFMQFAGLLLFTFEAGYAFLSKGCILMLMTLTNLFIFEEGNLDALKQAPQPSNKSLVVFSPRSSSRQVASNFKKFQRCILRINEPIQSEASKSTLINDGVEQFGPSTTEENNCNSQKQLNLKRMLGNTRQQDYDELADFVEFKEGKDYSKYEKDRKKYQKYVTRKKVGYHKERRRRLRAILA